jgi:hypothetical protein
MKTDRRERKVELLEDRTPPRDVGGIVLPESMGVNREMDLFGKWTKPGRLDVSPTITQDLTEQAQA